MRQLNLDTIDIKKETYGNYDVMTCQTPILNLSPHNQLTEEKRVLDHILPKPSSSGTGIDYETLTERQNFIF